MKYVMHVVAWSWLDGPDFLVARADCAAFSVEQLSKTSAVVICTVACPECALARVESLEHMQGVAP